MARALMVDLDPTVDGLVDAFEVAYRAQQQAQLATWRAAYAAFNATAWKDQEFVADELAMVMNVHPQTARCLLVPILRAHELPALLDTWADGDITDKHVLAGLDELHLSLSDPLLRLDVLDRVLDRCQRRAAQGEQWPTPGHFRRMLRKAALLVDRQAGEQREQARADQRGVDTYDAGDGQAGLALEGPADQVLPASQAIHQRALAASRLPGETRTLAQLEFDIALALLLGEAGSGTDVRVEVQVLVPVDTAEGRDEQPGELPGHGPVSAATCQRMLDQASTLRRICIDKASGRVLAIDDAVTNTPEALASLRSAPVVVRDLCSPGYRPTVRAAGHVRVRDQRCRFPGCTTRASRSDLDHLLPWPLGPTDPRNLHCLCRHHHRAKQSGLFTVSRAPDGSTVWTTRGGRSFRSPPPDLLGPS